MATSSLPLNRAGTEVLMGATLDATKAVAERNGLTVKLGRCKYDATGTVATVVLEFATRSEDGRPAGREAAAFTAHAASYGLDPTWLGQRFTNLGDEFRVVGLNVRGRKHPVLVERTSDGARFKYGTRAIAAAFGAPWATRVVTHVPTGGAGG